MHFVEVNSFDQWRSEARRLIVQKVAPPEIHWATASAQPSLFDAGLSAQAEALAESPPPPSSTFTVPHAFVSLAREVACHRDTVRWELLYRTLWRLLHSEYQLLKRVTDDDVHALAQMRKAVSRDVHKMKAFVRFRKVSDDREGDTYVAWHRPDHQIVRLAAPFFARRFNDMNWSILTPDESVVWEQGKLTYGPGVPASEAPHEDALEGLWRTYYASIFNPARIKDATMKREMPVRHWKTLPEASLIDDLLRRAPARVDEMIANSEGISQTAMRFMPTELSLDKLRLAAGSCQACPLHGPATQTVFGQGNPDAKLMIIGEQPGDREDIVGEPFVGPAGQVLDAALLKVGIDRKEVYLTNVVKHFKFIESEPTGGPQRGKRRLHKKPDSREIFACRPWLEAEIAAVRPDTIVCLGATPSQAIFGRDFRLTSQRGKLLTTEWCQRTLATWHPAAILRMPDETRRERMRDELTEDLRTAVQVQAG
ncbi:UdgX family uracil-DNA binding protein [Allorhodopirellula solitaria]|uniref:Type-4 uracil-DNA glycosylase n=1 Tax=Allorhodopirellula solitaria TaxID=2527987 RepID=A0A5C5YE85_9BACT|nr:UdgX family uracil-DNA binding protein [Allorhodopirellula solitaria]TWT73288.1 Uracil DNA glycosylase superfamily protein [Allorhodopirellula solitaria]